MRPWLELLRISNLPTVWSNLIAGAVVSAAFEGRVSVVPMAIVLVAGSCLYLAGMVLNDVFDAAIDLRERPQRPIPSGRVSMRAAMAAGWGLLVIGAGLPWLVSMTAGLVAVAIAVLVVFYDLWHARTAWSVVLMGLCRSGLYLLGAAAAGAPASPVGWVALPLLMGLPVLVHVGSFSMIARGEVPDARAACPRCRQFVLEQATVCPECGARCDLDARTARLDARRDVARGWWGTGTLGLLLPFLGCCSLPGLIAATRNKVPDGSAWWMTGVSLIAGVILGWYLVDSTRHLARHPEAVGRFVLRSIAALSLFDAGLVAITLPEGVGAAGGPHPTRWLALGACLACFVLTRLAHRRIAGT